MHPAALLYLLPPQAIDDPSPPSGSLALSLGPGGNHAENYVIANDPFHLSAGANITGRTTIDNITIALTGFVDGNDETITIGATTYPVATNSNGTATAGSTTFAVNFTDGLFTITKSGGGTLPSEDAAALLDIITGANAAWPCSIGIRSLSIVVKLGVETSTAKLAIINEVIAQLPTEYVPPPYSLPTGTAHFPLSSANLTTLLGGGDIGTGTLTAGDIIVLDPDVTYTGSWDIPDLSPGAGVWTYVVTKAEYDTPGTLSADRIRNIDYPHMATVQTIAQATRAPAIGLDFGAERWRFIGIRFVSNDTDNVTQYGIVVSGYDGVDTSTGLTLESQLPREIVFDRCEIKGRDRVGTRDFDGMNWNGIDMAFIGGRIVGIQDGVAGEETHAIQSWYGGRRYTMEDSLFESAGIGVIFGGTGGTLGTVSSDIVVRRCHFRKTSKWINNSDGHNRALKNLFELKVAERVLITASLFEDNLYDAQFGDALVFTPRNQNDGVPEAVVRDITVQQCIFRRIAHPIRISSQDDLYDSAATERIHFRHNLAYDLGYYGGGGRHFRHTTANRTAARADRYSFEHNTQVEGGDGVLVSFPALWEGDDDGVDHTAWRSNILEGNGGALMAGTGVTGITSTLNKYNINWAFVDNVIFGGDDAGLPVGNYNTAAVTKASVEFADYDAGDYSLSPSSDYAAGGANEAFDGIDQGADIAAINTALEDVEHAEPLAVYLDGGTTIDTDIDWVTSDGLSAIMSAAVVSYAGQSTVATAIIQVSGVLDGDDEQLSILSNLFPLETDDTATGTIGSTTFAIDYDATTQTFTITKDGGGEMPVADLQSMLRDIEYDNAAAPVTTGTRTITVRLEDGTNASLDAECTVNADDDGLTTAAINCRSTSTYVTDNSGETYCIPGDTYPVTRGGITFGWDNASTIQFRNRSLTNDVRLAGTMYIDNATRYFMIDVNPGVYDVTLACGDANTGLNQGVDIRDESGNSLLSIAGTPASNSFLDATGTARTAANWPSQNVKAQITVPTTSPQRIRIYRASGATYNMMAHIKIEPAP